MHLTLQLSKPRMSKEPNVGQDAEQGLHTYCVMWLKTVKRPTQQSMREWGAHGGTVTWWSTVCNENKAVHSNMEEF